MPEITDGVKERHWYWLGNERGITGILPGTYAAPHRALFSELRPEEWDARFKGQRVYNTCGFSECANPWHWELATHGQVEASAVARVRPRSEEELVASLGEMDIIDAYNNYVRIITNDNNLRKCLGMPGRLVPRINERHPVVLAEEWTPTMVALIEKWLEYEELMTASEAEEMRDELLSVRRERVARESAAFSDRLARAVGGPV